MALARITTFQAPQDPASVVGAVHAALVETLQVPIDDPTVVHQTTLAGHALVATRLGDGGVLVEVTMFEGRRPGTRAALHRAVSERLAATGIEPAAVLCVINELPRHAWSLGGVPQDQVDLGFTTDV
jgi:phenylpyruvate tautomerase PptA (4-oxalocrotonate tautomerase family)